MSRTLELRRKRQEELRHVLWANSDRLLPRYNTLRRALKQCGASGAWWTCEANRRGPVYFLPTVEWVQALADFTNELRVKRVLEVGAGDGFLARSLKSARQDLQVFASDSGAWEKLSARTTKQERLRWRNHELAGLKLGDTVHRMNAVAAVKHAAPDLTIVCWAPPGNLVERVIANTSGWVLEIRTTGLECGSLSARRFAHQVIDGPLLDFALCRLDGDRRRKRPASQLILYRRTS